MGRIAKRILRSDGHWQTYWTSEEGRNKAREELSSRGYNIPADDLLYASAIDPESTMEAYRNKEDTLVCNDDQVCLISFQNASEGEALTPLSLDQFVGMLGGTEARGIDGAPYNVMYDEEGRVYIYTSDDDGDHVLCEYDPDDFDQMTDFAYAHHQEIIGNNAVHEHDPASVQLGYRDDDYQLPDSPEPQELPMQPEAQEPYVDSEDFAVDDSVQSNNTQGAEGTGVVEEAPEPDLTTSDSRDHRLSQCDPTMAVPSFSEPAGSASWPFTAWDLLDDAEENPGQLPKFTELSEEEADRYNYGYPYVFPGYKAEDAADAAMMNMLAQENVALSHFASMQDAFNSPGVQSLADSDPDTFNTLKKTLGAAHGDYVASHSKAKGLRDEIAYVKRASDFDNVREKPGFINQARNQASGAYATMKNTMGALRVQRLLSNKVPIPPVEIPDPSLSPEDVAELRRKGKKVPMVKGMPSVMSRKEYKSAIRRHTQQGNEITREKRAQAVIRGIQSLARSSRIRAVSMLARFVPDMRNLERKPIEDSRNLGEVTVDHKPTTRVGRKLSKRKIRKRITRERSDRDNPVDVDQAIAQPAASGEQTVTGSSLGTDDTPTQAWSNMSNSLDSTGNHPAQNGVGSRVVAGVEIPDVVNDEDVDSYLEYRDVQNREADRADKYSREMDNGALESEEMSHDWYNSQMDKIHLQYKNGEIGKPTVQAESKRAEQRAAFQKEALIHEYQRRLTKKYGEPIEMPEHLRRFDGL